ncbi:MAG: GntR family transcriptional regulator [Blautia marasmi]
MIPPAKGEKQIPFEWRIYRERPQVCYSLASHIMHHIYMGRYRDTDFLPSYERMAEEYRVSVSTVRRTIKVLNQLGAARTINGKGTRIFRIGEPCDATDFEVPAIRRNLAYFIQSFELLVFSCETVMREFLTAVSQEERNELIKELEENLDTGRCELSLWYCLLLIARYSPLQGIREIYGRIYSLFLWGYPLKTSYGRNVDSDRAMYDFTVTMISRLKENAIDACAETLRKWQPGSFLLPSNICINAESGRKN